MDDDPPEPDWESWMVAREPAHLFRQDAEADERRARLAREVLAQSRSIALGRASAERTWLTIQANLRKP